MADDVIAAITLVRRAGENGKASEALSQQVDARAPAHPTSP